MDNVERRESAFISSDQPLMSAVSLEDSEDLVGLIAINVYKRMTDNQLRKLARIVGNQNRQIPPDLQIILLGRGIS